MQLKLDDYKNQFGIVFTGKLDAPKDGEYVFQLASDDGGAHLGRWKAGRGATTASTLRRTIAEGKVKLKKGVHEFRLEYFQAAGAGGAFRRVVRPGICEHAALEMGASRMRRKRAKPKKKNAETTGMPLVVAQEPLVYRNFIAGGGNRGIGVGYPGNANIAWSAEYFGLAVAWRGAFIDAARHWNGRGGGAQLPLGFDVIRPAGDATLPFAINPRAGQHLAESCRRASAPRATCGRATNSTRSATRPSTTSGRA